MTSRRLDAARISNWLEPAQALPTYYLDALHRAGGLGASLLPQPVEESSAAETMARFDGLLVSGGVDLDPVLYGESPHPETVGFNGETDRWEIALIHAAIAQNSPVLAICRGAQLLNVAFGGSLHQHLGDIPGLDLHGIPNGGGGARNQIHIDAASRVGQAVGATTATGNCHHHQAVHVVGDGLAVVARTADGVVEAIEPIAHTPWVVGVQWHPEDSAMHDPMQQKLFAAFIDQVRHAQGRDHAS